jgi:hypothetical protein
MTGTDVKHDIEPHVTRDGLARARCLTHKVVSAETFRSMSEAVRLFRCDEGQRLRFIVEVFSEGTAIGVSMHDLTGVANVVYDHGETRPYCHGSDWVLRISLWRPGQEPELLTVEMQHATESDADGYATHTWAVLGQDKRVLLTVDVRVDGRN